MYYFSDVEFLNKIYNRKTSDIAILYGNKRAGLFNVIQEFTKNKKSFYYKASTVEKSSQDALLIKELYNQSSTPKYITSDYEKLLQNYIDDSPEKKVIVLDEFSNLIQYDPTFLNFLMNLVSDNNLSGTIMIILCSTNINWIENDMINALGNVSYNFSGLKEVSNLDFFEYTKAFNNLKKTELFCIYSILGGSSRLWNLINDKKSVKNNIVENILSQKELFISEGESILPEDLRQKSVYNTILYYISTGNNKLNDLYKSTGMDRAKISVYLKALIEHKIIYKEESAVIGNKNNISKAIYKIQDPFVNFWYCYIFSNFSSFYLLSADKFYKKIIEPTISGYLEAFYPSFTKYLLMDLDKKNNLPFGILRIMDYSDKNNLIDYITYTDNNEVIICSCNSGANHYPFVKYELLKENLIKNKIKYDKIILFSSSGYDQELSITSHLDENLIIFENKDYYMNSIL